MLTKYTNIVTQCKPVLTKSQYGDIFRAIEKQYLINNSLTGKDIMDIVKTNLKYIPAGKFREIILTFEKAIVNNGIDL